MAMSDPIAAMDGFGGAPDGAGAPRRVVVLGATGSIGTQAAEVMRAAPGEFDLLALCSGGRDLGTLTEQALSLRPRYLGVPGREQSGELRERLLAAWPAGEPLPEVLDGPGVAEQLAGLDADLVLNAMAGDRGLPATLAALGTGARVALANKESLVAGGPLVVGRARPGQLVPVDSEHSALAQCLRAGRVADVRRFVLTASGGPFRGRSRTELAAVTVADALRHPTWAMGPLITVNSATLVNKGQEIIEAHLLYGVPYDRIDAVVHPQSIVHSMVEYVDGSTIAAASPPDMKVPIALALAWPHRLPDVGAPLDWSAPARWTFEPLDDATFPAVALARRAGTAGGCAPAVYNAANEELVDGFMAGRCGYLDIADGIAAVLEGWLADEHAAAGDPGTVEQIADAQRWARARAQQWVRRQE
jgi:1-deoxy-D-xylulose-5-phosphate reductoisomerase